MGPASSRRSANRRGSQTSTSSSKALFSARAVFTRRDSRPGTRSHCLSIWPHRMESCCPFLRRRPWSNGRARTRPSPGWTRTWGWPRTCSQWGEVGPPSRLGTRTVAPNRWHSARSPWRALVPTRGLPTRALLMRALPTRVLPTQRGRTLRLAAAPAMRSVSSACSMKSRARLTASLPAAAASSAAMDPVRRAATTGVRRTRIATSAHASSALWTQAQGALGASKRARPAGHAARVPARTRAARARSPLASGVRERCGARAISARVSCAAGSIRIVSAMYAYLCVQ